MLRMNETNRIRSADRERLHCHLRRAVALDPGLERLISLLGYPEPRRHPPGFATLLQIIISQQVSTRSAAAIQDRLERSCRGSVTCRKILNRGETGLRQCGFSRRKAEYAMALSEMVYRGELDLAALGELDTEGVVRELTRIRGFGRWSGQIYAMFALDHRDVFPEADLGLQMGVQRYLGLEARPTAREVATIAERWSPCRSAVSLLMWKYHGAASLALG